MPWDSASRLKPASQLSKLPVFRQFGWARAGVLASSTAARASTVRRVGQGPLLSVALFAEDGLSRKQPAVDTRVPMASAACWSRGISPILLAVRRKVRARPAEGHPVTPGRDTGFSTT